MMYEIFNRQGVRLHVTCNRAVAMKFAGYGYLVVVTA